MSDGETLAISDFTVENSIVNNAWTHTVTINFYSKTTTLDVPSIYNNLANTNSVNDFEWNIQDDYVIITKYVGTANSVVVPAHINRVPVMVIGDYAFEYSEITSVEIPASVQSIGYRSFIDCQNLSSGNVYFAGSEAEWSSVDIADGNTNLKQATFHYNYQK